MENESKEYSKIINEYVSQCSSFLEYGIRGGMCGSAVISSLKNGHTSKWSPRYVGIDLIKDQSIEMLAKNSKDNDISFQFWQGHSSQYPLHETDGFLWDIFHSGGALFNDLERVSPYVHKYMIILGVRMFGDKSEAVIKGFDIQTVSRELQVSEDYAKMGMREGIDKFLNLHKEWYIVRDFAEICVMCRKTPNPSNLFRA